MATVRGRLAHALNVFLNNNDEPSSTPLPRTSFSGSGGYSSRPDRPRLRVSNERSIIASIYNRIAIDFATIDIRHVRLDEQKRYKEEIDSGLNNIFNLEANLDQAARHFKMDIIMSLFDAGEIALVPIEYTEQLSGSGTYSDIQTMRVGRIVQYFPQHVRVSVYNEMTGRREEVTLHKRRVAIVENPLHAVMNEPNSTLQRLLRKLSLLDLVDEQTSSGKLDMIIQLPYTIRGDQKRRQAEQRRADVEDQLKNNQLGIAYTGGDEKITQLNRPIENNLLKQIESLLLRLYAELGMTAEVMNGTADEGTMLNYYNRTIEPLLGAVQEACIRSFLTKTARSQGQWLLYFRDPFKLVPMAQLAELADKFTRNEIVSSNEFRGFIGMKPSDDPKADQLRNSNMPQDKLGLPDPNADPNVVPGEVLATETEPSDPGVDLINSAFDEVDGVLDKIFEDLGVPASEDEDVMNSALLEIGQEADEMFKRLGA